MPKQLSKPFNDPIPERPNPLLDSFKEAADETFVRVRLLKFFARHAPGIFLLLQDCLNCTIQLLRRWTCRCHFRRRSKRGPRGFQWPGDILFHLSSSFPRSLDKASCFVC